MALDQFGHINVYLKNIISTISQMDTVPITTLKWIAKLFQIKKDLTNK